MSLIYIYFVSHVYTPKLYLHTFRLKTNALTRNIEKIMLVDFRWTLINILNFIFSIWSNDFAAYQTTDYLYVINRNKYNSTF